MSPTALKRAAAALVVLVAVWAFLATRGRTGGDDVPAIALPRLNQADVDRILIERPADTVDLSREGTEWRVNGFAAAAASVGEWFTSLTDATEGSQLVARSASSHERMGVGAGSGRRVRFFAGNRQLADVIVGNRARLGGRNYVRSADTDDVYEVQGMLTTLADRSVSDWRDRRIAAVVTDSIATVEVVRRDGAYVLARADSVRWAVDGDPADSATVARLVGALVQLEVSGFPTDEQLDSISFADPYRRLRVARPDGSSLLSLLFDSTTAGTWVRHDSGGSVYRLDRWRIDGLTPADSVVRATATDGS